MDTGKSHLLLFKNYIESEKPFIIESNLSFYNHTNNNCRKVSQKYDALARVVPYTKDNCAVLHNVWVCNENIGALLLSQLFSWNSLFTETVFLSLNMDTFLQARIKLLCSSLQSLLSFSSSLDSKGAARHLCFNWMSRWRKALKVRGTGKIFFIQLIGMWGMSSLFWSYLHFQVFISSSLLPLLYEINSASVNFGRYLF